HRWTFFCCVFWGKRGVWSEFSKTFVEYNDYPYSDTFMSLLLFRRDLWMRKKSLPLVLATGKPCFTCANLGATLSCRWRATNSHTLSEVDNAAPRSWYGAWQESHCRAHTDTKNRGFLTVWLEASGYAWREHPVMHSFTYILTASLSCAEQICPCRIAAFRAQATQGSSVLRPRKPL